MPGNRRQHSQAEAERKSDAVDFRLLFESVPGPCLVLTPRFTIVAVSDAYLRATMTVREEILGKNVFDVFPDNPNDPGATGVRQLRASLETVIGTRRPDQMAFQKYDIRRPEAEGGEFEERFWSPLNSPVIGPAGEVLYIIHRVEDVTEFVRLQRAAGDKANPELAALYEQISTLMAQADHDLRDPAASPKPEPSQRLGVEEMLRRVGELITGHKRLEEELRQSQKMEAVGQLAGGIAHDFNNVLNVIIGYSKLLLQKLPAADRAHRQVEEICKAGERAAGLTQQLLAFSRKQVLQPRIVNFGDILREMDTMVRRVIGEHIQVNTTLEDDLAHVKIDPTQVQQVILNLVVNARDAMPDGGKLTLELSNAELDASYAAIRDMSPGRYVMLAVSDNGCGMTPEVRQRAFEPFFTTKGLGSGTGLGLATVYGIIRQSGGHIWLYSEPGAGTTFKVFFPSVDAPEDAAPARAQKSTERGSETILVVEDDPAVRHLVEEILGSAGYHVMAAEDGPSAMRVAERHRGEIDLLLTDVVLPKMGSKEVASRLTALRPEIKVIFMSGYTGHSATQNGALDPDVAFIPKPFSPDSLCDKVRAQLNSRPAIRRVLVVDDEPAIRGVIVEMLRGSGFQTFTATDGRDARQRLQENPIDLIITDLAMEGEEGIELIRALRKENSEIKIIAMSGTFGTDILTIARALGADATLAKPVSPATLLKSIEAL